MVRSMTGYARVRRQGPAGEAMVSIKCVNHRGLDLHFHLSPELDPMEIPMRTLIKKHIGRGHVEIRASMVRTQSRATLSLNRPLLKSYLQAFREASSEFGLEATFDLNAALRAPGMLMEAPADDPDQAALDLLLDTTAEALQQVNAFREREGHALMESLRERSAHIRELTARIADLRSRALPVFQARVHERLSELLRGSAVDPQRLLQEAAFLADRSDIGEELERLRIHTTELEDVLSNGHEVGKKLDFLLQEMNRETNTILSKTSGLGDTGLTITSLALAIKSDVEKIREQSLNLE